VFSSDVTGWAQTKKPHSARIGVGWAKRYVEILCRFWYEKNGPQVVIARASNIYGEDFAGTGESWLVT